MIATPTDPRYSFFDKYEEPQHHLTALLEAHVITLVIPARILFPLAESGVKTVGDLLRLHRSGGFGKVYNFGAAATGKVEKVLSRADLFSIEVKI